MARVFQDELDARDLIAESMAAAIIQRGYDADDRRLARKSYDIAEAFLEEREERLRRDRQRDDDNGDDDHDDD